jgi:hypothetical protein
MEDTRQLGPRSRIGIDIGRVIVGAVDEGGHADTTFLSGSDEAALATPPVPGAFETIRTISLRLDGRVWLVSKCGRRIEALTRRWLVHQRFHEATGIPPDHLRFCRERPQKRDHAVELGLTHFVDDRLDVLAHLRGAVGTLCWFGLQREAPPDWVFHAPAWTDVATLLLGPARDP